ncbi:hypothetical protein CAPGI0001_1093 [Capnocytophaga gingivalis ATCC 33624]|jgi:hypothetical protein|uniref:hypothetical protein n=2 Tax=Capnocytophaga gingivalis TaxID=1017 RepID=UPI00019FBC1A|nr:hypothetical protein [Capnocytophaga gingivalis]EEK13868.1 hypothetical protein CAPGI0001_1093 [Capnocytophaga gingivalis ATCC 33624]RKW10966.1 MAG: hypothetical protein D8H93_18560 [Capnocytophaga sp.]
MTGSEIQEALDKLCLEMKDSLSGFLFCGILKCSDGTIMAKASASVELLKTAEETSPFFTTIVTQVKNVVFLSESLQIKEIHSILIETDKVTYVIGVSNKGKFFNLLVLERDKANIGIARALIEKSRPLAMALDEQL